jgi:hypothetical protein
MDIAVGRDDVGQEVREGEEEEVAVRGQARAEGKKSRMRRRLQTYRLEGESWKLEEVVEDTIANSLFR